MYYPSDVIIDGIFVFMSLCDVACKESSAFLYFIFAEDAVK